MGWIKTLNWGILLTFFQKNQTKRDLKLSEKDFTWIFFLEITFCSDDLTLNNWGVNISETIRLTFYIV